MLTVYLPLPAYMRQWLARTMGEPARFPNGSFENALLARHLTRLPPGQPPQLMREGCAPIAAPVVRGKPHDTYNYLPRRGQAALAAAISALFTIDLWGSCVSLLHASSVSLNEGIEEWCRSRSITAENREAVRQRFYRMRKGYAARGIVLGKRYRKREKH